MEDRIIEFMEQVDFRPLKPDDLAVKMVIEEDDLEEFFTALRELETQGRLILTKKGRYGLCRHMNLFAGHLEGHSKGYAFFIPDEPKAKDIYISSENLNGAMDRDRVIIRKVKDHKYVNGREEGEVVRILTRANKRIVGHYEENGGGFVRPDERRIPQYVYVSPKDNLGAKEGDIVVVEIVKWSDGVKPLRGKVTEIIGQDNDKGTDMLKVIRKYQLPEEFSQKVWDYAANVAKIEKKDYEGRRDLRREQIVTMDGADAKDLDDAVSLKKLGNGNYLLGVHIADVGNYVKVRTPLDREAYARGTSVYFPDRVIPMLPPTLSNGICSLNPHEDRLTLSCVMEIDQKGRVVDYDIFESVISSQARLTYDAVNAVLDGDKETTLQYKEFKELFFALDELRQILYKKRENRGALMFDFPEAKVVLDEEGTPIDIKKRIQGRAESIIEECMIVANETVASEYFNRDIPFVYRVHDAPPDDKIIDLKDVLASCGLTLGVNPEDIKPYVFQKILTQIEGKPEGYLLQSVILRTMSHAVYDTENRGHFGLASDCYCHFTSPIRRYPDLCIHRVIKDMIHLPYLNEEGNSKLLVRLNEAANQSSIQERNAEDAEREATDIKMTEYMAGHIGEEFEGIISGTTNFGFFVELENTVNGLVHVSSLDDDYYEYHENTRTLMGKRNRVCYRLGDKVRVVVSRVNPEERLIDFELVKNDSFKEAKK